MDWCSQGAADCSGIYGSSLCDGFERFMFLCPGRWKGSCTLRPLVSCLSRLCSARGEVLGSEPSWHLATLERTNSYTSKAFPEDMPRTGTQQSSFSAFVLELCVTSQVDQVSPVYHCWRRQSSGSSTLYSSCVFGAAQSWKWAVQRHGLGVSSPLAISLPH